MSLVDEGCPRVKEEFPFRFVMQERQSPSKRYRGEDGGTLHEMAAGREVVFKRLSELDTLFCK